jgi:hypothetical protein
MKGTIVNKTVNGKSTEETQIKPTGTELAVSTDDTLADVFLAAAEEAGSRDKFLKFKKGHFVTGKNDTEIPAGREYVAYVRDAEYGWIKFQNETVVEGPRGKITDGFRAPAREALGDNEQSRWKQEDGKPRDPWCLQWYLPLIEIESGEVYVFVSGSDGGKKAIGDLLRTFARNVHRGKPIVKLEAGFYPHPRYGRVDEPKIKVVSWENAPPSLGIELNDRIPF